MSIGVVNADGTAAGPVKYVNGTDVVDSFPQLCKATVLVQLPEDKLPSEIKLFSYGVNKSSKGDFVFDSVSASRVMARYASQGNDMSLDYEHAAFQDPPGPAPAAAWFSLELRADGLYATNIKWTEMAADMLRKREYRYFSPAFIVEPTEDLSVRVVAVMNAALTNIPALANLIPLVEASQKDQIIFKTKEDQMELKAVVTALGCKEDEAIGEALKLASFRGEVIKATGKDNLQEALGTIAAWRKSHDEVQTLNARVAEFEKSQEEAERAALVKKAEDEGKIPAKNEELKTWLCSLPLAALREYVAVAPSMIPQVKATPVTDKDAVRLYSEAERKILRQLNITPEQLAKAEEK